MRHLRPPSILLALWELPQNLTGLALLGLLKLTRSSLILTRERQRLFVENDRVAVSLGWFVFWTKAPIGPFDHDDTTKLHEYGHTLQSRCLGPLYLPLVGIPSVSRVVYAVAYYRLTGRRWTGYFDGWPERQADALGGVTRPRR